jgi:hypothetical protein
MGLAGKGVVAIWNGIRDDARAEFYEWHNREHMPERVGIPGFLRGRRYRALEGHPEYFTLYETRDAAVLTGADYLARLNAPTEWTKRVVPRFTDTARSLCRVALSYGRGGGGLMMTWRFEVPDGDARRFEKILQETAERPGVAGVYLGIADRAASDVQTEEKKGRPANAVPGWVLLIEGAAERAALEHACAAVSDFLARSDAEHADRGLYQVQHTLLHSDGQPGLTE